MGIALAVQIPIYVFCILSDVLCLVGAIKNNKRFLVPFIVKMVLLLSADAVIAILFIYWGATVGSLMASTNDQDLQNVAGAFGATILFVLLIPLLIGIGIGIYFLVIVVRYFKEISSVMVTNFELSSKSRTELSTLRMDSHVANGDSLQCVGVANM